MTLCKSLYFFQQLYSHLTRCRLVLRLLASIFTCLELKKELKPICIKEFIQTGASAHKLSVQEIMDLLLFIQIINAYQVQS